MPFWVKYGVLDRYTEGDWLSEITVPETVERIGNNAFVGCDFLTKITVPEGVRSIGDWAFYECEALREIILPDSLRSIGDSAFENCKSLVSVTIPAGIKRICSHTFLSCGNLREITVPESVQHIGKDAFRGCRSLRVIRLHPDDPALDIECSTVRNLEQTLCTVLDMIRYEDYQPDVDETMKYALLSLRYMHTHDEALARYIRSDLGWFMGVLFYLNAAEVIAVFCADGIIPKHEIDRYIEIAQKQERTEIMMLLMRYKNEKFGFNGTGSLRL